MRMMDDSLAAAVTGKVALACDFGIPPHSWGTQIHVIYDSPRRPTSATYIPMALRMQLAAT